MYICLFPHEKNVYKFHTRITGSVKFTINIFVGTGEFQICESGSVVAQGIIKAPEDANEEALDLPKPYIPAGLSLTAVEIYKELGVRGYEYRGSFRGIKSSDNYGIISFCIDSHRSIVLFLLPICRISTGISGKLDFNGNYVTFMDTMLQFSIIGFNVREVCLPTRLQRVLIDPLKHRQVVESLSEGEGI